jgi:hypothetical protein
VGRWLFCDQVDGARQHFEHNDVIFASTNQKVHQ